MSSDQKKFFNQQIRIWNLKLLGQKLLSKGFSSDAYVIRRVLDLLSPNWMKAKAFGEIILYRIVEGDTIE